MPLDNEAEVDDSADWKVFQECPRKQGKAVERASSFSRRGICGQPPAIVLCGLFLVIVIVILSSATVAAAASS